VAVWKIRPETRIDQCEAVAGANEEPTDSAFDQSTGVEHPLLLMPSIGTLVRQRLCRLKPADDGAVDHWQDLDVPDLHLSPNLDLCFSRATLKQAGGSE
jgi:hypothetical protein